MEVGGLGVFNSPAATGKQPMSGNDGKLGSFAGMMATVLSQASVGNGMVQEQAGKAGEILTEIAAFLKTTDLLELEDGLQLLEELTSGSESLLEKVFVQFGVSNEEVQNLIQKWTSLNKPRVEDMPEDELIASLAALLSGIANLSKSDLAVKLDEKDLQAIKALKLYDLMSKYADANETKSSKQLKETLKEFESKLGTIFQQNNGKSQTEYLQTRFTRLAVELNLTNSKNIIISDSLGEGSSLKAEGSAGTITFLPQMGKAEQLTLMMNSPERPVSAEQLMKQFESILAKSQFMNSGGTQKLFIKLFPEHLGSIRVELFQKDQTMVARIITSSGIAKDALESQLNGLKQAFASQNISVEKIEISQQNTQQERFLNKDSQQQNRQPEKQESEKKDENSKFSLSFEEALLSAEA